MDAYSAERVFNSDFVVKLNVGIYCFFKLIYPVPNLVVVYFIFRPAKEALTS